MAEDLAWFSRELRQYPLPALQPAQIEAMFHHYELLLRWNPKLNLTSILEPVEIVRRHYAESIFFSSVVPFGGATVADIGSGAGFPGIPLAIHRPHLNIYLVESHQRKAVFLRESTRLLANVSIIGSRAEVVERCFDWLASRAVRPSQVIALLPARSCRVALLIGEKDFEAVDRNHLEWADAVPVPWAERQLVAWGVSRGTGEVGVVRS